MAEQITFTSQELQIQGVLRQAPGNRGVVLTHPHPLYGGDMSNPVVETMEKAYSRHNCTTLRFNFRGVGRSEGSFDGGQGERHDLLSGVRFLEAQGKTEIHLAGYSFGAWIIAELTTLPESVTGIVMISPPVALMPHAVIHPLPLLQFVVTGEEDEIAPPELVREHISGWNDDASFHIVDFADHFYSAQLHNLEKLMREQIQWRQ